MVEYKNNSCSSGVYQLKNIKNGKCYIGSTFKFGNRKYQHFKLLNNNNHPNKKLQNSFNKHGKENFIFEILEICDKKELLNREQYYLDNTDCFENGYNILRFAHNSFGYKHSDEVKEKISKIQIGKKVSEKVRKMLLGYSKGRVVSLETRKKLSDAHKGKKLSEETKLKLSKINSTPVEMYDLNNNFIKEYSSIKEASLETGISFPTISDSLKNKRKPRKYIWKKKFA